MERVFYSGSVAEGKIWMATMSEEDHRQAKRSLLSMKHQSQLLSGLEFRLEHRKRNQARRVVKNLI
jgi:hypothetical protein